MRLNRVSLVVFIFTDLAIKGVVIKKLVVLFFAGLAIKDLGNQGCCVSSHEFGWSYAFDDFKNMSRVFPISNGLATALLSASGGRRNHIFYTGFLE